MWKWLEQYFTFTRGERNGISALLILCLLIFVGSQAYLYYYPSVNEVNNEYDADLEAFIKEYYEKNQLAKRDSIEDNRIAEYTSNPFNNIDVNTRYKSPVKREPEYFDFDPNKIGVDDWVLLGFSEKQAESIEKLKAKGFKFYKPEDLKRVYVIGEDNYNRLKGYVRIDESIFKRKEYPPIVREIRPKEKFVVDINTADSSLFERQRGIGPSLASRIIKYRTRLGGFTSPEQIKEVWNFPDSTYQNLKDRFIVSSLALTKVNINTADFKTLGTHPYINFAGAKVIDAYRKQHLGFKSVEEVKRLGVIPDSIYLKLEPYLTID
ncbi:MAG: helix-hairpin-helix domain-containing protein [Chitinophagales bacterium]